MRPILLALLPTLALVAAETAPGLAMWDAGAGTIAGGPAMRGAEVRPGAAITAGADGPVRVVLPGTANAWLTLAAGSSITVAERRVSGNGSASSELLVTLTSGAVAVGGDPAPRFAAVRLRGISSETVAAPGVGVVVETDRTAGDTVVALDGPVSTGPLPATANGWQAAAERVTLTARSVVLVDPQRGVGEPAAAPGRPQLAGTAGSRAGLRAQVTAPAPAVDAWSLDSAARELGPADPSWWTAPPAIAQPAAAERRSWSVLIQLSAFQDSNPSGVATALGGRRSDRAWSVFGDARWTCWSAGDYAVRLQAVGGQVRYRGVAASDGADVPHDSRDKDQRQAGANAALVRSGGGLDWSVGLGGVAADDARQDRTVARVTGDLGRQVGDQAYAVLNLGWAGSSISPEGSARYRTQAATARPALTCSWPDAPMSPSIEASILWTDSRSRNASDDFYAIRPGVACSGRVDRLDLGLSLRHEAITYRVQRAATETVLARENVVQATATADWWSAPWWSAGVFANQVWFRSNQPLADYNQTQVGVRSTVHW